MSQVGLWSHLHPKSLEKQYKNHLSNFIEWSEKIDEEALVFPENFSEHMALDEVMLHKGDYYTVLTNKAAHGRKGSLAALIKGTKAEVVSEALSKVPIGVRMETKSVSLDLAENMEWIVRTNFMNAVMVGDRFHVQQVVSEGVQELRIYYRRKAIDEENEQRRIAKEAGLPFRAERYRNGDTKKQLLAKSRHLLFMPKTKWTESQWERASNLFHEFPDIKKAYDLSMCFRSIFENAKNKEEAKKRMKIMKMWMETVKESGLETMQSCANTVDSHLGKILNYFLDSSTNAAAESFNAKLKGFRSLVRGVRDIKFFLYRITKLYA